MPDYRPEKHHFVPAFHQQPWTIGGDGKVCEMRLINGRVVPKRVHPNATGFQRNLYTTAGIPADQAQHLETNFFTPLDTQANIALRRMLTMDKEPWPIAPDAFFLASNDPNAVKIAASRDHSWMVREINLNVVGQAVEFVWGVDDSQLSFAQKHFGKSPLPPAITAAQRDRAVAAARGEVGL